MVWFAADPIALGYLLKISNDPSFDEIRDGRYFDDGTLFSLITVVDMAGSAAVIGSDIFVRDRA